MGSPCGNTSAVGQTFCQDGARVWQLLSELGATLFVCGDAKHMASDVNEVVKAIARSEGGKSAPEAEAFVQALKDGGRYHQDIW